MDPNFRKKISEYDHYHNRKCEPEFWSYFFEFGGEPIVFIHWFWILRYLGVRTLLGDNQKREGGKKQNKIILIFFFCFFSLKKKIDVRCFFTDKKKLVKLKNSAN